ncbi:MAG TPA: NAD-dependent epimerase/dehydratase family protein, partial [Pyrinomonadaceae bacterium]|nr:NAD-dependent epimerase/dehydratase family protein [Pyrinomonadaceae bacterium]
MKILITGSSGLIGQALTKHFSHSSAQLLLTTRKEPKTSEHVKWSAEEGFAPADLERIEGVDVVIHLAGESVFGIRWSEEKKAAIRDSRVRGTKSIVDAIASLATKPSVFISASAIGYYGDRDDEILTEASPAGNTFLSEVCREWEAESRRAEDLGVRTVLLRNGIVLSKEGGALATMILPFKF